MNGAFEQDGVEYKNGDLLGLSGQTSLAGGDHLHFSMIVNGVFVDPLGMVGCAMDPGQYKISGWSPNL
ncbi:MAG: hypothetical protein NTY16_08425 [Deltaproteobacteria bacterium]|nr:hypothetical protein [Deltaproteobacteria bacterium]